MPTAKIRPSGSKAATGLPARFMKPWQYCELKKKGYMSKIAIFKCEQFIVVLDTGAKEAPSKRVGNTETFSIKGKKKKGVGNCFTLRSQL